MGYTPAPPTRYRQPTLLAVGERPQRVWGDDVSGEVLDTIYVSNETVHLVEFSMEPGAGWRDSEDYKTYFSADVVYYVLRGELVVVDVSTGETKRVPAGAALHVPPETWHHGFNRSDRRLDMVEFIAPTPTMGSTRGFYRDIPLPDEFVYAPADDAEADLSRLTLVPPDRLTWRPDGGLLVAVAVATETLTVGVQRLAAGTWSGRRSHRGGLVLYVLAGAVGIDLDGESHTLGEADGFFLPGGTGYDLHAAGDGEASMLFEIAPPG